MLELIENHGLILCALLGVLSGIPLMWNRRERLMLKNPFQAVLSCITVCAICVASAMLFATMEGLISGEGLSFGAISTYGVYFFCPLFLILLAWVFKRDARYWLDVYALCAMPTLFLLRCNCLLTGCCGGRVIPGTDLHWPTREAEMVFYVVMLLVLLRREKRGAAPGTGFPLLMAAYGTFRFIEEWFRAGDGMYLIHLAHAWSLAAIVIGFGFYYELKNRENKTRSVHRERRKRKC